MASEAAAVTRYRDVAVVALCTADVEHAARFTATTLGRLAEPDDHAVRLAETLAVYLSERRNRVGGRQAAVGASQHRLAIGAGRPRSCSDVTSTRTAWSCGSALSLLPAVGGIDLTGGPVP